MDSRTIFTKTAKGLGEVSGKTKALSRDLRNVLKEIDGKSPFAELLDKISMPEPKLRDALNKLMSDNYIREFAQPSLGENTRALDFSTIVPPPDKPVVPTKRAEPQQRRAGDFATNAISTAPPEISPNTELQFAEFRRLQLEEQARHEAQVKAKKEADEKKRREQEAKVQRELEEWASKEVGDLVPEIAAPEDGGAAKAAEEAARRAAEAEAKKQAEELGRIAAQQQAQEQARRQAEEHARREAENTARLEAEQKARQEAEAAARRQAEEQARKAAEEQVRRELELKARKEAEEKARREAEDRARKAAEEKARQEAEAKARQEAEARRAAEEAARRAAEAKARQEAELAAKREAEARARKEAEERARVEAEQRARQEAEERARQEAELRARKAAEELQIRKAAEELQARKAAEERQKREAEERARKEAEQAAARELESAREVEQLAQLAAQEQVRLEAEARTRQAAEREVQEQARKKAVEEARRAAQQVREEASRKIKSDAQEQEKKEAEEWVRREVEERERRAAEARGDAMPEDVEPEEELRDEPEHYDESEPEEEVEHEPVAHVEQAPPAPVVGKPYRKPVKWGKWLMTALGVVLVAGFGLLHVISFDGRIPELQKLAAQQFGQPVKIRGLYFTLLPQPHWRLSGVTIGSEGQISAPMVRATAGIGAMVGGETTFGSLRLESPVLSEAGLDWLLFGKVSGSRIQFTRLEMSNATLTSQNLNLGSFNATASIGADGAWKKIVVDSPETKLHVQLQPNADLLQIELTADSFTVPFGSSLTLEHVSADGTANRSEISLTQFRGSAAGGTLVGGAKIKRDGGWKLSGQLTATYLDAVSFAPVSLQNGKLNGDAIFSAESSDLGKLLASPRLEGNFVVRDGVVLGVDLASLLKNANLSGKTNFSELNGGFLYDGSKLQLRRVALVAGLLSAKGTVDVDQDKNLNGRFLVEIKSTSIQSRANLNVAGTVREPRFSP